MKHFLKYFLVAYLSLFCTNLLAQDKIVILDLKYVLNESKAGNTYWSLSFQEEVKPSDTPEVKSDENIPS